MMMRIGVGRIEEIARHRNGVSGAPFHVVKFTDEGQRRMLAVVFESPGHCAVMECGLLVEGVIAFGANSWRGDNYEPELRRGIAAWENVEALARRRNFAPGEEGDD